MRTFSWALVGLLALAALPSVQAAEPLMCTESHEISRERLLRRASLDLRGRVPSYEEYVSLDTQPDGSGLPDLWLDAWMDGEDFRRTMRHFHENLLWPNVRGVQLTAINYRITASMTGSPDEDQVEVWSCPANIRRKAYRKGNGGEICGPFEQVEFLPDGTPVVEWYTHPLTGDTYLRDGWVWVNPYWDPEIPIRVCAFDAQAFEIGENADCTDPRSPLDPRCGCGEDLHRCYSNSVESKVWNAMREQLGMLIDDVTVGGYPYTDLVTSARQYSNGTLDYWKANMANFVSYNKTYNPFGPGDALGTEAPSFIDEDTWRESARTDVHAGVQSLAAFTLRFQTNRARANRFRTAFMGQYFTPPVGEDTEGCDPEDDDLTQRCTCRHCHQVLEPLAAYFGKVSEAGSALITDLNIYEPLCDPAVGQVVAGCDRFYVVDADAYNPGTLIPWQYADREGALYEQIAANLEGGPGALAEATIASGVFAVTTVKNLWRYLMGRDVDLDPQSPTLESQLLAELAAEFEVHNDFRWLVKTLVSLPQYRRVR